MSTYLQSYRDGTVSVTNGSTTVTGSATAWSANVQPGDRLVVGAVEAEVATIASNTSITLVAAWSGSTATGASYAIHRWSKGWAAAGTTALLLALYESNRPTFIPVTGTPSNSVGADGNIAVDWTAGLMYQKAAGVWGTGVAFRTRPRGAYSAGTAYAVGDIVTHQSGSWIALIATTGNAPPTLPTETNTQWTLISKPGTLVPSGTITANRLAVWVDGTTVTSASAIVEAADGKIGIGITSPTEAIHFGSLKTKYNYPIYLPGATVATWNTFWSIGALYFAHQYGYLGTNGSFKLGFYYNGFRNSSAGWTSLGINSSTVGSAIELGPSGIDFAIDSTVSGATPTTRLRFTPGGDLGVGTTVLSPTCRIHTDGAIRTGTYTVATLPSASTSGAGARAYVTDATVTTFASTVAGGGSNKVPVYSNGTNWLIG